MSLRFGVLGMLFDQSMTGYDIYHYFSDVLSPMWYAQQSQVYRELGLLEKEGFVTSLIEPQVGKPNKRIYSITEEGIQALTLWIGSFDYGESMHHRDSFSLRIFFAGRTPQLFESFISQLHNYIEENQKMLHHLKTQEHALNQALIIAKESNDLTKEDYLFFYKVSLMRGTAQYEMNCTWANEVLNLCKLSSLRSLNET